METSLAAQVIAEDVEIAAVKGKGSIDKISTFLNLGNAVELALHHILLSHNTYSCAFCNGKGHHVK